jgi:hypothetical protein
MAAGMPGRKTPRHQTGHTEPIQTPALRHSIDGITLSYGKGQGERTPSRRYALRWWLIGG